MGRTLPHHVVRCWDRHEVPQNRTMTLGSFLVGWSWNRALDTKKLCVEASVFSPLKCIPKSGIAGLRGKFICSFLTNCQTVFQSAVPFY